MFDDRWRDHPAELAAGPEWRTLSATMNAVSIICSAVQVGLGSVVILQAVHRLQLLTWRWRLPAPTGEADRSGCDSSGSEWPEVTVQLPVYNERLVVGRLLAAVSELDYPRERLQVQVLDDSDDETREIVDQAVERMRRTGLSVEVVRRPDRAGFKAGALHHGLATARGELIAVFDADFVPSPGFLRRLVPRFAGRPDLGMVQARWGYRNADINALTRVQAWMLDAHFRIEHGARWRRGCAFNFNGTAGIWRRSCIDDAGGWQGDTLTEDLDLSYRAQCGGWQFDYADDEVVASELPEDWDAFKAQQYRWAKGASQCARKLLPRLWSADSALSWRARVEGSLHLLGQGGYVVFIALLVAGALGVLAAGEDSEFWRGAWLRGVAAFAMVAAWSFFAATLWLRGGRQVSGRDGLALLLSVPVAIGLAIGNARAVLEGWLGAVSPFERTPKRGDACDDVVQLPTYRSTSTAWRPLVEVVLGGLFAVLAVKAVAAGEWFDAGLAVPASVGLLWAGGASLVGSMRMRLGKSSPPFAERPTVGNELPRDRTAKAVDVSLSSS